MLPHIINESGAGKLLNVQFGGINRRLAAANGDIKDDENITSDEFPVLMSRAGDSSWQRYGIGKYGTNREGLAPISIDRDGVTLGNFVLHIVLDEMQTITLFENFYVIMPEKMWTRADVASFQTSLPQTAPDGAKVCVYSNSTTPFTWMCYVRQDSAWTELGYIAGTMEQKINGSFTIIDGTIAGIAAEANTIHASAGDFRTYFSPGDSLTLSGVAFPTTRTLVVREVAQLDLRFDEHSFDSEKTTTAKSATIAREMPDMDFIFGHDNRLWGAKGQTIYASKLGDFRNWNNFEGISTDSYSVDVNEGGVFTGGISYMGFPMFFKTDTIYKVYGSRPSNFEVKGYAQSGCVNGGTLAVVNESLYYLSREGVMRYSGGSPQLVSDALGDPRYPGNPIYGYGAFDNAFADGTKYMMWKTGTSEYYEYDTRRNIWHKQAIKDGVWSGTISYAYRWTDVVFLVSTAGHHWRKDYDSVGDYNEVPYMVEFARFDLNTFASKYPVRLWFRYAAGNDVTLSVAYDGGDWETSATLPETELVTKYVPVPIRRCDSFRIKITGTGDFQLYAMQIETRAEETNRKGG